MSSRRRTRTRAQQPTPDKTASPTAESRKSPGGGPAGLYEWLALGGILLLGLLLRGAYLSEIVRAPGFSLPNLDGAFHDHWARGLASGDWPAPEFFSDPEIHRTPFFRPPGYPYFLSLIYLATGSSYLSARVVQMALGLVNCVLAHVLARSVFGRGVGLILAGLMSCYWAFIYFEGEPLAPVLLVFLALALLNVLRRWVRRTTYVNTFAGGVLLGLFALTRPNVLLFAPLALVWIWWVARRHGQPRRWRVALVGFPTGAALAIAPATLRNYVVASDLVLITSNAGVNFYIGNNERTDCVTADIPILGQLAGLTGWTCFDQPAIVRGVEEIAGRPLKSSEVSSFFRGKALEYITANPLRVLGLALRKALLFWGPAEISNNKVIHYERSHSATLRLLPGFPLALSLALVGLLLLCLDLRAASPAAGAAGDDVSRRIEPSVLILLFVGTYFASFLPFFVAGRYRVPVIPFLLLFGAYGLYRAGRLVGARRWRPATAWAAVWLGLFLLANWPLVKYEPDLGRWHFDRGDAYRKQGKTDLALREFRLAVETGAWPDPRAYNNLGAGLFQQQRIDEAIASFREAARLKPDYVDAHLNLATALVRQDKLAEALPHFSSVVRFRPDHFEARYNLGTILLGQNQIDEAITHLTEAVRLNPQYAHAHTNLAQAFKRAGRIAEAIKHYTAALRLDPDLVDAHYQLATLLAQQGEPEQAVAHLQQALRLKPGHAPARHLLDTLRSE